MNGKKLHAAAATTNFQVDRGNFSGKSSDNISNIIPISGGKPDNELFDKSRTERRSLHASTGNSFNCMQYKIISYSTSTHIL